MSYLMITKADVRTVLDEVIHPSFGMLIIALDMVRTVRVGADRIEVDLVMNCPGCPAGEVALALARKSLAALNGRAVKLNLLPQVWAPHGSNLLDLYLLAHRFPAGRALAPLTSPDLSQRHAKSFAHGL